MSDSGSAQTKKCPWCAEEILLEAKKCKHCGEFLREEEGSEHQGQEKEASPTSTSSAEQSSTKINALGDIKEGSEHQVQEPESSPTSTSSAEQSSTKVKASLADVTAAKKQIEHQAAQIHAAADKLETQATDMLAQGNEELAREALSRRAALAEHLTELQQHHERLSNQEQKLGATATKMETMKAPDKPSNRQGAVWAYEKTWRCIAHDKRVCPSCFKLAKHPTFGKKGDVVLAETTVQATGNAPAANPNAQIVCPHCQVRGHVTAKQIKVKKGFSTAKTVAAIGTAGLSAIAGVGLAKKGYVTQMHCSNCGTDWQVQ
jgi:PspA/IM30 family